MSSPAIVVQARTSSSRLPGKVLADLHGRPLILRLVERLQLVEGTGLVVATSVDHSDDTLASTVERAGVRVHRGSLHDVLSRYVEAARLLDADPVVRITADCPLADPALIGVMLAEFERARVSNPELALLTNVRPPSFPDGLDVEIAARWALERAHEASTDAFEREHVTRHLHQRPDRFHHVAHVAASDRSGERWTVDYPQDLEFVRAVYDALYPALGPRFTTADVEELLARNPAVARLQSDAIRAEALGRDPRPGRG